MCYINVLLTYLLTYYCRVGEVYISDRRLFVVMGSRRDETI